MVDAPRSRQSLHHPALQWKRKEKKKIIRRKRRKTTTLNVLGLLCRRREPKRVTFTSSQARPRGCLSCRSPLSQVGMLGGPPSCSPPHRPPRVTAGPLPHLERLACLLERPIQPVGACPRLALSSLLQSSELLRPHLSKRPLPTCSNKPKHYNLAILPRRPCSPRVYLASSVISYLATHSPVTSSADHS